MIGLGYSDVGLRQQHPLGVYPRSGKKHLHLSAGQKGGHWLARVVFVLGRV